MTQAAWSPAAEETALVRHLVREVCSHLSGRAEPECSGNTPRDVYFVGNLRPVTPPDPDGDAAMEELRSKLAPMAFGADFLVEPDGGIIEADIALAWSCYYRVFPTWEEQRRYQQRRVDLWTIPDDAPPAPAIPAEIKTGENEADEDARDGGDDQQDELPVSSVDRRRSRRSADTLASRWRKVTCMAEGRVRVVCTPEGECTVDVAPLMAALAAEADRAAHVVANDPQAIRAAVTATRINVPDDALASEKTFFRFLAGLHTPVRPEWGWSVEASPAADAETRSHLRLGLVFANASPAHQQEDPNVEPFLFDVRARVRFTRGMAHPFRLEQAPKDFRFDPFMAARGFNCAVETDPTVPQSFRTTMSPLHVQKRYVTREEPPARFADLAADPLPHLERVLEAMEAHRDDWIRAEAEYEAESGWAELHAAAFARDRAHFEDEVARFRAGVEILKHNPDVATAFRLTNEVFRRLGEHPDPRRRKESWRLFQIVFVVTQIPGIAALAGEKSGAADREMVDIVYFPTGGGKTEAYLGVIAFHLFFDRLRGKRAGLTAWTRFPLRLLTLQQTQRTADLVAMADLVRREQGDSRLSGPGVDPFLAGYFVGKSGSPNELIPPGVPYRSADDEATWSKAQDPVARQDWKRVARCPSCRTETVVVDFDEKRIRLLHRCTNAGCAFQGGVLPVLVVDNDLYRHLPAVVVGTIDKLAGLGNQRKLSQFFGRVTGQCPDHGYLSGACCQKGCSRKKGWLDAPAGLSGPTLFVQDELHLLKEGLGTFDAHYETFAQRLLKRFGQNQPLKIIASSATIEAFDRQVEHLYGRHRNQARIFPGPGPAAGKSFYALTLEHPSRIFVGVIPHNKTIFNAVLELVERFHREIARLAAIPAGSPNPYRGRTAPGSPEWARLLDRYRTSLTYFLATRELNSFRTDIDSDVNPTLEADRVGRLQVHELSGSTSTDEVTRVLNHIEGEHPEEHDAVLATAMVSHGVDVDRLNAMFFYGMPRQNAEYIQASSRVGRTHVGIAFVCLHPARERDRSHFAYFSKYHEYVGKLVEPVAINRWAKFSVERTLPGLFMATLLQVIANESGVPNPNAFTFVDKLKQQITDGTIRSKDFLEILEDSYLVATPANATESSVQGEIRTRVGIYLDQIVSADSSQKFVSSAITPRPMMSLRDTDETITIELDSDGTMWSRSGARA